MQGEQLKEVGLPKSGTEELLEEVLALFNSAIVSKGATGISESMRRAHVRSLLDYSEIYPTEYGTSSEDEGNNILGSSGKSKDDCGCSATGKHHGDFCGENPEVICSLEDTIKKCGEASPFNGIANLLSTVKKYEFIALVENAYAQIGNRPFSLKANKTVSITEEEKEKAAKLYLRYIEDFIESEQITVDEIPDAFNAKSMFDLGKGIAKSIHDRLAADITNALAKNEDMMELVFNRANFMKEYIAAIRDTTEYPIGILWCDDKVLKDGRIIKDGKLVKNKSIQCDAERIDPCFFWATDDFEDKKKGGAVFKMEKFSFETLSWITKKENVAGSRKIIRNIKALLSDYPKGKSFKSALLFSDWIDDENGFFDVIVCRGTFSRDLIKGVGIKIPSSCKDDQFLKCEIHFTENSIIRARVLPYFDERLGVFTTSFRRRNKSIYGYSLHDFTIPFSRMYEGAIKAIDSSSGKSVGSLIQIDRGVMVDPDRDLKRNADGELEIDFSGDTVVEFDSTTAFGSPNFKGIPITIDQLPSDLQKLLPIVDFIHKELEYLTGIPSILVNSSNISSALRTTSNFNAAFNSSAKVIKALLREGEYNVLEPAIRFFFDAKAMEGDFGEFLMEAEPEILLSDTLTREQNDDMELLRGVETLYQFREFIPQEKLSALINNVGREVYNLEEDLIPDAGILSTNKQGVPANV